MKAKNPPEKVYVGPFLRPFPGNGARKLFWGPKMGCFWVGAKKFMLKKFMCFVGSLEKKRKKKNTKSLSKPRLSKPIFGHVGFEAMGLPMTEVAAEVLDLGAVRAHCLRQALLATGGAPDLGMEALRREMKAQKDSA